MALPKHSAFKEVSRFQGSFPPERRRQPGVSTGASAVNVQHNRPRRIRPCEAC